MAVLNRNPWGDQSDSFEQIRQTAKPIKKAAGDAVKAVAADVKQQVTGDYPTLPEEATLGAGGQQDVEQGQAQTKQLTQQQQKQVQDQNQQLLVQTRQNLEQINQVIKKVRQEKAKQAQQKQQVETHQKAQKIQLEEKKKEEPVWKKMLTGKTGSREAHLRTTG